MKIFQNSWRSVAVTAGIALAMGISSYALSDSITESEAPAVSMQAPKGPGYLDCDGTRYMAIPYDPAFDIEAGGAITISAKVWLDSYGEHRGIVSNRWRSGTNNANTTGYDIFGGYSTQNSMSNNVNLNTGSWNNIGHVWCNTLPTKEWAVVTWVFDGASATSYMYIDGDLKDTVNKAYMSQNPINPGSDILVGCRYGIVEGKVSEPNLSWCWLGKIKDVRFYSKALSAAEVAANLTSVVDESTPDLIAAYDFTDINGLEVTDISGNGHNGVLVGFPEYSDGAPLTIVAPANGTIKVYNGDKEVLNGQNIEDGTELTVESTPALDCHLVSILVNGEEIEGNTFVMNGATTVTACFERDANAPTKVLVFDMDEDGSRYYRIPAIVTAADGSLVVMADKRGSSLGDLPNTISIVSKRSTDGGKTWSKAVTVAQGDKNAGKTYGDPAVVLDRTTGNLIAVFAGDQGFWSSTKWNRAAFYMSKSTDNGVTWSEPVAITDQLYQSNWWGTFAASGSMLQTHDGKIMFVANTRLTSAQSVTDVYEFVCCTEDGGDTWKVLNADSRIPAAGNGNESKLVETSDGTLIMSIRSRGARRFSKSTDGGVTWSPATAVAELVEPDCNGDIIVYPSKDGQTRMLHSLPNNPSTRRDVSIFLSYDEGETWPVKRQLLDNYSAYSSLTVLEDGTIGCFVEEGKWDSSVGGEDGFRLYFMNFDLSWLTNGADNGEGSEDAYTLTIETPSAKEGTLKVFDGENAVVSGRKVKAGTILTIVPTPADNYLVHAVTVNGHQIMTEADTFSFVMEEDATVAVEFVRDPNAPVEYCYLTGSCTRTDSRGIVSLSVSDNEGNTAEIPGYGTSGTHDLYVDNSDMIFKTAAGNTVTIENNGTGTWMSSYVYIDYDKSGTFDFDEASCSGANVDGELVTHTGFNITGSDPTVMCDGSAINWQMSYGCVLPTFVIPADLPSGLYRIRHKIDWNCTDPCGRTLENGYADNFISANGGGIIDFTIQIGELDAVESIESDRNAPVEYFNLQGIKVTDNKLAPGIYIMRQGKKVAKIAVR